MLWNDPAIEQVLATAWSYMRLVHPVAAADAILALGSFDPMVAVCAAALWHARVAPIIIMSGGIAHRDSLLATGWDSSEAQVFADVAVKEGVPRQAIILEDKAQNTGENFSRSKALSEKLGLKISSLIVVAKPYMTRRGLLPADRSGRKPCCVCSARTSGCWNTLSASRTRSELCTLLSVICTGSSSTRSSAIRSGNECLARSGLRSVHS